MVGGPCLPHAAAWVGEIRWSWGNDVKVINMWMVVGVATQSRFLLGNDSEQ
jgi:hypothetical protein